MVCEQDIKTFQKSVERQRVYLFLGGLDDVFDQVRGEVLRKDPPLGLEASYAYVRREAERKEAMKMEDSKTEPVAMTTKTRGPSQRNDRSGQARNGQTSQNQSSQSPKKCAHCGLTGHLKNRCYELIGYP